MKATQCHKTLLTSKRLIVKPKGEMVRLHCYPQSFPSLPTSAYSGQSWVGRIFSSFPFCFVQRLTDHLLFTHAHSWFAAVFFWARQLRYQLFSSAALICPTAISLSSGCYPFMNVSPFRLFMLHLSSPIRANFTSFITQFYICSKRCSVNLRTYSVSFYALDTFQVALIVEPLLANAVAQVALRPKADLYDYQTAPTVSDCILFMFHCVLNV